MDQEKLYDYLKAAGKPLTIGQINSQPEFANIPRRELAQALQALAAENIAFRSVKEGKAYYSANPAEGVSRNPCQKNIDNIAFAMNRAFGAAQNPELEQMGKVLQAFDQLIGAAGEESSEEPAAFTYHNGTVADCGDYSIGIPDGFKLEMGKDDRDFVAWLPGEDSEELDDARITLFAGQMNSANMAELEEHVKCPELCAALIRTTQWAMKIQADRFLGPSIMADIPLKGQVTGSYLYNGSNYQIMLGFPAGIKQMRVLVNEAGSTQETYHQAVTEWIATLKLKKGFAVLRELDSDTYLPLTDANVEAWENAADQMLQRISVIQNMNMQARIKQFEYDRQYGNASMTLLKKDVREIAKKALPSIEKMYESIAAFLKRVCDAEPSNENLMKVYEYAVELQAHLELSFNLNNEPIRVVSDRLQELKDAIELPVILEKKAEIARREAEKKAAEEAERRRKEEERRQKEEERCRAEEARKREEEERRRIEAERRRAEEERRRIEAERRRAEEEQKRIERERLEAERRRKEEEERAAAEKAAAERRAAEEKAAAERRAAEEKAAAELAEKKRAQKEAAKRKLMKILKIIILIAILLGILAALTPTVILPAIEKAIAYNQAAELLEADAYDEAAAAFRALGDYRDASSQALEARYQKAEALHARQQYPEAIEIWNGLGDYSDSVSRAKQAEIDWKEEDYQAAQALMDGEQYIPASEAFTALGDYKDSTEKAAQCLELQNEADYQAAVNAAGEGRYEDAMQIYQALGDYKDSADQYVSTAYLYGCRLLENGEYQNAISNFEISRGYQDTAEKKQEAVYLYGCQLLERESYVSAIEQLGKCGGYQDADKKLLDAKFGFVQQHLDNDNQTTLSYLKELVAANYSGAKKVYEDLYSWKVEILGFNNSAYSTVGMNSISKYSGMYAHFQVTGGLPGESTTIKAVLKAPNGQTGTIPYSGCTDGTTLWVNFYYDYPSRGATGTLSLKVYDENGKLLASGSVRVTN